MTESLKKNKYHRKNEDIYNLLTTCVDSEGLLNSAHCLAVKNERVFFRFSSDGRDNLVYDLGSLTGSIVTTSLILFLIAEGRIKLEDRVSRYLQNFGVLGKAGITIAHLLTHTAGLPSHYSFQKDLPDLSHSAVLGAKTSRGSRESLFNAVNRMALKSEPGLRYQWSEIGFLVLGLMIETITGSSIDELAEKYIFNPLLLKSTSFISSEKLTKFNLSVDLDAMASSGKCPVRAAEIRGEPFDFVARALGGVAGHAGLFSNLAELACLGVELCRASRGKSIIYSPENLQLFSAVSSSVAEESGRLPNSYGWQDLSSFSEFSASAFGRATALGSSLWVDPDQDLVIAITANRRNPTEPSRKLESFRLELANKLVRASRNS